MQTTIEMMAIAGFWAVPLAYFAARRQDELGEYFTWEIRNAGAEVDSLQETISEIRHSTPDWPFGSSILAQHVQQLHGKADEDTVFDCSEDGIDVYFLMKRKVSKLLAELECFTLEKRKEILISFTAYLMFQQYHSFQHKDLASKVERWWALRNLSASLDGEQKLPEDIHSKIRVIPREKSFKSDDESWPESSTESDIEEIQQERSAKPDVEESQQENSAKPDVEESQQESSAKPDVKESQQENSAKQENKKSQQETSAKRSFVTGIEGAAKVGGEARQGKTESKHVLPVRVRPEDLMASPYPHVLPHMRRSVYYMDFKLENLPLGRVLIETLPAIAPLMSANFAVLCTAGDRSKSYKRCRVFQCWAAESIITGDVDINNGNGGTSAINNDLFFPDESPLPADRGAVGMRRVPRNVRATKGKVSSQFRILLTKQPQKTAVFGHVIQGLEIVQQISALDDGSGNPTKVVIISDCGKHD